MKNQIGPGTRGGTILAAVGVFALTAFLTYGSMAAPSDSFQSTPYQNRIAAADQKLDRLTGAQGRTVLDGVVSKVKQRAEEKWGNPRNAAAYNAYLDAYLAKVDQLDDSTRSSLGSDYEFLFQYIYPRVHELRAGAAGNAGAATNAAAVAAANAWAAGTVPPPPPPSYANGIQNGTDQAASDGWTASYAVKMNPESCMKHGTKTALLYIDNISGNAGYGTASQKAYISAWVNSDVANLTFDDSVGLATWGSSNDPQLKCKIAYAIDAVCGSVAGKPVSYRGEDFVGKTTLNACAIWTYGRIIHPLNGKPLEYLIENSGDGFPTNPDSFRTANYKYVCEGLNGGNKTECKTGLICPTSFDANGACVPSCPTGQSIKNGFCAIDVIVPIITISSADGSCNANIQSKTSCTCTVPAGQSTCSVNYKWSVQGYASVWIYTIQWTKSMAVWGTDDFLSQNPGSAFVSSATEGETSVTASASNASATSNVAMLAVAFQPILEPGQSGGNGASNWGLTASCESGASWKNGKCERE